jgi:DNA-directed RNA polymerase specialized sigma24 family protein
MQKNGDILYNRKIDMRDPEQFESLYDAAKSRLNATIGTILRTHEDSEDVLNWTFFKASKGNFRGECAPITWLTAIARNEALTYIRQAKQRHEYSMVPIDDNVQSQERLREFRVTEVQSCTDQMFTPLSANCQKRIATCLSRNIVKNKR